MKSNINVDDPNGVVPKYYPMNPETEDLLYGDALENDMVVLVEPMNRFNENEAAHSYGLSVRNRWCTVSELRFEEDQVYFIGIYADGQKAIRDSSIITGWVVKKNSIPTNPTENEATHVSGPFAGLPKDLGVLSGAKFRINRKTSVDENRNSD